MVGTALRLRLLIPNGGYCFTMVVTALRLRLFILNTDSSFLYIFHFFLQAGQVKRFFILERERLSGRKSHRYITDPRVTL